MKKSGYLMVLITLLLFPAVVPAGQTLTFSTIKNVKGKDPSIEILTRAYDRLGIKIKIEELPAQRSLINATHGEFDGEAFRIKGLETKFPDLIIVDTPCSWIDAYVYVRPADAFKVDGWKSIPRHYTIAAQFGLKYIEQNIQDNRLDAVFVRNIDQAFKLLSRKKADFVVTDKSDGNRSITRNNLQNLTMLAPKLERIYLYHYLHKKNARLVPQIKAVLQAMHADGSMDAYLSP